jgi:hypothetical protein
MARIVLFSVITAILVHAAPALDIQTHIDKRKISMQEDITVTIQISDENIKKEPPYPSVNPSDDFKLINKNKYQSSSQNISIVNGKMQRTIIKTFTYQFTFKPLRIGDLNLPGLHISAGSVQKPVAPTPIKVLKESPESRDINLSLSFQRRQLYVNEQVALTVVIKKKAGANIQNIAPPEVEKELKKFFWVKSLTEKITGRVRVINNERFEVYPIKYIVFPIVSGRLKVPSIPLNYSVLERSRRRGRQDPFFGNAFFGSFFESIRTKPRTKYSRPVVINVRPLPDIGKPAEFDGAVGVFSLKATLDKQEVKAGEAVNLTAVVSGRGNEKSIGMLHIQNAGRFEIFEPEVQSRVDVKKNVVYATKTFKYVIIPQAEGEYRAGPVSLYYFNPEKGAYDSAQAGLDIRVLKGKAPRAGAQTRYLSQEEIRLLGKDIRYIKTEAKGLTDQTRRIYDSGLYKFMAAMPFFYTLLFAFARRRSQRLKSDIGYARFIRAKSNAQKLLAKAGKKHAGPAADFYSLAYRATVEFIADKLNMAAASLTSTDIEKSLSAKGIGRARIKDIVQIIETCDLYRFSSLPDNPAGRKGLAGRIEKAVNLLDRELK